MRPTPRQLLTLALAAFIVYALARGPAPQPDACAGPANGEGTADWYRMSLLRCTAKDLIARDVVAGRTSLLAAAALFRELNELPPRLNCEVPMRYLCYGLTSQMPGRTPDERLCRQVLLRVEDFLNEERPGCVEHAFAAVTAEYRDALRRHGRVCVPPPRDPGAVDAWLRRAREATRRASREALPPSSDSASGD
jgi:hypothetical protein